MEILPVDLLSKEIAGTLTAFQVSILARVCKLFLNIYEKVLRVKYISVIDDQYEDVLKLYLADADDIGIINTHVKYLYAMKRLNHKIYADSSDVKVKTMNKYMNIPRFSVWDGIVIQRTPKQLVKSIYLHFGLKIHKFYYFVPPNQENLLKLLGNKEYRL